MCGDRIQLGAADSNNVALLVHKAALRVLVTSQQVDNEPLDQGGFEVVHEHEGGGWRVAFLKEKSALLTA